MRGRAIRLGATVLLAAVLVQEMPPLPYAPDGPGRDCRDCATWEDAQRFYEAAGWRAAQAAALAAPVPSRMLQ